MIVYLAEKAQFLEDVDSNRIDEKIHEEFQRANHHRVGRSEATSWRNSMNYMQRILEDSDIPHNAGVAIEFGIPGSAKRIDFILTGRDQHDQSTAVIVELKQWTEVETTSMDAVVRTFVGGAKRNVEHPSYQAWSYATMLEDFNEGVRDKKISLKPCAYLHNCESAVAIKASVYRQYVDLAPAFLKDDAARLRTFIKSFVKTGDSGKTIYEIKAGRIRPSKNLADQLSSMLQGNREFVLIDDQKLVYEAALELSRNSTAENKNVLLVEGGPGTGKSVVAINLLVQLTSEAKLVHYVTKNAAPRAVYESKLSGSMTRTRISNLFKGSGAYTDIEANFFSTLIVDEAHRLNEKSGMYQNLGENQVKELIQSAHCTIFFLDENQRVTLKDIGSKAEIRRWAATLGAKVTEMELQSQFRCNGSDAYLAWVDHTLGIRDTANPTLEGVEYDVIVCDSPQELRDRIIAKNKHRNKARMVAGYCWDWVSRKTRQPDIQIPEHGFEATWNLAEDGNLWIIKPDAVHQIGCIHTCQGLELDYVGVILGPDFLIRNGEAVCDASRRSSMDSSIKGFKKLAKSSPEKAKGLAALIIRNTYRTLMTRGQKGCYLFSVDRETNEYLKRAAMSSLESKPVVAPREYQRLSLTVLNPKDVRPYINAVPVFDLKIAAGKFSEPQVADSCDWVELPDGFAPRPGLFVAQVIGESMNRRISNGSWCIFRSNPTGSRQGKVMLVEHRDIQDPEGGSTFTVKIYRSEKISDGDSWMHSRIILKPDSTHSEFKEIVLTPTADETLRCAEFVASLG